MANKITGSTDTSGALTVIPNIPKSVLVVARVAGSTTKSVEPKKIFQIYGTADAIASFGADSIAPKIVKVLIANGVDNIKGIIVPEAPESSAEDTTYKDSLEVSMLDKTIKCIITDSDDAKVIAAVKDHLIVTESNDMFRYSVFGTTKTTQAELAQFAKTVDSNRIFIVAPQMLIGTENAHQQICAAGLTAAIMVETSDPALPMNGVNIKGFSGVGILMLSAEMDALVKAGVTPIYDEDMTPAIWRLVTSAQNDQVWQEGSTRFIADYVLESVENMLRKNYKRTKNVTRVLNAIRDDVKLTLQTLNELEIIENFDESTVTVSKDPADRYGALIDYEFDVVTPLYTITINQHLKL